MKLKKWLALGLGISLAVASAGALAIGNFVYESGTQVPCKINDDDLENRPEQFFAPDKDNGPFPGEGWDRWVGHDLSDWWLTKTPYEAVSIHVSEQITLSAWWITPQISNGKTVMVTHGIGTYRRDFNTLLPTAMLVKSGFNVLLIDSRDTGESTCTDGRHSAGQEESTDFAEVAKWLVTEKQVPSSSLGMFGVSGGAIATSLVPAKTDLVSAFAMEGTIFDFNKAATREVEFQGYPGVLWQLALISARVFHGVDLAETSVQDSIVAAKSRPMLILHGDSDQRLDYQSSVDFYEFAKSKGSNIRLETFVGADHTEGMLLETERYALSLVSFFEESLK
jgi:dipeptidyl aminopeptidase/acylaminoacyl peptidase